MRYHVSSTAAMLNLQIHVGRPGLPEFFLVQMELCQSSGQRWQDLKIEWIICDDSNQISVSVCYSLIILCIITTTTNNNHLYGTQINCIVSEVQNGLFMRKRQTSMHGVSDF